MKKELIKCDSVKYRQGYIEVLGNVHSNNINLEVWQVHADRSITGIELDDESISDEDIIANIELELSVEEAEILIEKLTEATKIMLEGEN